MTYIEQLNKIMERLRKEDNLSIAQILKMDMFEYNKQLVERAAKELDNSKK